MELIKKLHTIKNKSGKSIRQAIFKCGVCNSIVTKTYQDGLKNKTCGCHYIRDSKFNKYNGESKTRIYQTWYGMKRRCTDVNYHAYHRYGGRGISVCVEWSSFIIFKEWAFKNGYSDNLQIDRINGDEDYSPDNCEFTTPLKNMRKNSHSKLSPQKAELIRSIHKKKKISYAELGEMFGVTPANIGCVIRCETWMS